MAAAIRGRVPRPDPALAVLLAVAAVLSVAWSIVTPPLQGPDENQHVAYVQRIVERQELPQRSTPGRGPLSSELSLTEDYANLRQPPTNPAALPDQSDAQRAALEQRLDDLGSDARADGDGHTAAYSNPPLYYLLESVAYAVVYPTDLLTRMQVMRLVQVPLLLVAVWMTWLLAAEVLPRPYWGRVLAAGAVALHPGLTFISGVINPDIALVATWSTFLLVAVRTVTRGPTMRRALGLGALCAVSALIQPRGLGMGLPAVVALGIGLWRAGLGRREWLRMGAATLGVAVAGLFLYFAIVSLWGSTAANAQVSGTLGGGGLSPREFGSYLWQFYFPGFRWMTAEPPPLGFRYVFVESFFAVFGSLDVFLPGWVYDRLWSASLYALVALVVCLVIRRDALRRHWAPAVVLAVSAVTFIGLLHFAQYQTLQSSGNTQAVLVGRYLFSLIPLYGLAIAVVATTLRGRWGRGLGVAVLGFSVVLSIAALGSAFMRYTL